VKQLGEILVDDGLLTPDQLVKASEERDRLGRSLGRVLVDLGMVTEAQLVGALAAQIGMTFVDLGDFPGGRLGRRRLPRCGSAPLYGARHRL